MISEFYSNLYETEEKLKMVNDDPLIMKINNFLSEEKCNELKEIINNTDDEIIPIYHSEIIFDLFKKICLLLNMPGRNFDQNFQKKIDNNENNVIIFLNNSDIYDNIEYDSIKRIIKKEIGKILIINKNINYILNENTPDNNDILVINYNF